MRRYLHKPARRDDSEPAIIAALVAAGAAVTALSQKGVPDLLVGYHGATFLLEVKCALGPQGGNRGRGTGAARISAGGDGTLSAEQIAWWATWTGGPPAVVRSAAEALAAIGAPEPSAVPATPRKPGKTTEGKAT